ncbi:hypothetical protein ACHAWT_003340 [Skeletonema menzelii]
MSNTISSDVDDALSASLKRKAPDVDVEEHHDDSEVPADTIGVKDEATISDNGSSTSSTNPSPPPARRRKKDLAPGQQKQLMEQLDDDDKRRFTAADDRRKNNDRALMAAHAKLLAAKQELTKAQAKVNDAKKEYEAVSATAQENAEEDSEALLLEPSQWNAYYFQLKAFYDREGHCNFKRSVTEADLENMTEEQAKEVKTLSWWTWRQRKYKRRGELEQHKILLLNKLGFIWDPHAGPGPGKWLKNYALLKEFKEKHGHVKVPAKGGEYDKLGSWMKTQITQYRNAKEGKLPALSEDRIKLLDEIGMHWGEKRKTTPWDDRYEALIQYRKRFGHVNVPWQWKENVALAQWVNSQRKKYKDLLDGKRNNLTDEQINRLNLIGFKWNSGGKGRYTADSPAETSFGESDMQSKTMPETLTVPMFPGAAVSMTGEMFEAARVAAEGNAVDPNAQAQVMAPNVASFVPFPQVPANFMPFMGAPQQQQVVGINPQAQAFNYAQHLNLLRYQQLAQAQQPQPQNSNQNNMMLNNGLVNAPNNGSGPFVNMPQEQQPPPSL